MLSHAYNIVIDIGVGETGIRKYVVDGLNATDKNFLQMLMTAVKLMINTDIIPASEFQKHLSNPTSLHALIVYGSDRKLSSNNI